MPKCPVRQFKWCSTKKQNPLQCVTLCNVTCILSHLKSKKFTFRSQNFTAPTRPIRLMSNLRFIVFFFSFCIPFICTIYFLFLVESFYRFSPSHNLWQPLYDNFSGMRSRAARMRDWRAPMIRKRRRRKWNPSSQSTLMNLSRFQSHLEYIICPISWFRFIIFNVYKLYTIWYITQVQKDKQMVFVQTKV